MQNLCECRFIAGVEHVMFFKERAGSSHLRCIVGLLHLPGPRVRGPWPPGPLGPHVGVGGPGPPPARGRAQVLFIGPGALSETLHREHTGSAKRATGPAVCPTRQGTVTSSDRPRWVKLDQSQFFPEGVCARCGLGGVCPQQRTQAQGPGPPRGLLRRGPSWSCPCGRSTAGPGSLPTRPGDATFLLRSALTLS